MRGVYSVHMPPTAITGSGGLIELTAGTNRSIRIIRAYITQVGLTSSNQVQGGLIYRTSAYTTNQVAATPRPHNLGFTAFGGTARVANAAACMSGGSDNGSTYFGREGFNILGEYKYILTPEEYITVTGAGLIALQLLTAPAVSTNFIAGITFMEM